MNSSIRSPPADNRFTSRTTSTFKIGTDKQLGEQTMIQIDELIAKICQYGALAARRYVEVSGEDIGDMPESFMASFIFDRIGADCSATLESVFSYLSECNEEARVRRGAVSRPDSPKLAALRQQLKKRLVDMVVYEGEEVHKPKDRQDTFALVEFKAGYIDDGDREKLMLLLEYLDLCRWGIRSGWTQEWQRPTPTDRWFETKFELPGDSTRYIFYAQYFPNPISAALKG